MSPLQYHYTRGYINGGSLANLQKRSERHHLHHHQETHHDYHNTDMSLLHAEPATPHWICTKLTPTHHKSQPSSQPTRSTNQPAIIILVIAPVPELHRKCTIKCIIGAAYSNGGWMDGMVGTQSTVSWPASTSTE